MLDLEQCKIYIDEYNQGTYRGRRNIDLDRLGYSLFAKGLPEKFDRLTELVRFTGEDYGGTQARFLPDGFEAESTKIAKTISAISAKYKQTVSAQQALCICIPNLSDLRLMIEPFFATKRWLVWASKFLHFLSPKTFAMIDSRVIKALRFRRSGDPLRDYSAFLVRIRDILIGNADTINLLCKYDPELCSELKVLDKVFFQQDTLLRSKMSHTPAKAHDMIDQPLSVSVDLIHGGAFLKSWISNIASHSERVRSGDRFELCISKKHTDLFPGHTEWFELIVDNFPFRAQIGKKDGVRHLYLWTNLIGPIQKKVKITWLLQSVGLRVGDRPLLGIRGQYIFELCYANGESARFAKKTKKDKA
jgi:hypothetical protein